ncbi:MAG: hypothetical protein KGK44_04195 [Gammaproteobacteria bacterium]|nr:hypothetical protein [Gammaproteobacteria bacterium]
MNRNRIIQMLLTATFLSTALTAQATAYSDLEQARTAFQAVHSWHAVEQMSNGHTVTVDHVAPDRWRIQVMPDMSDILIGNDMYMVRDGKAMHMPFVMPQIQQMVNQNWLSVDPEVKRTVRDLGMQKIDGKTLHAYSFTSKGTPVKLYLSSDHLPAVAIVTSKNGSVTITYSDYNSKISINP